MIQRKPRTTRTNTLCPYNDARPRARIHARNVARQKQIAFGVGDIEHRRIVEPREVALQQFLVRARVAAHLDPRHARGKNVEPDDAVADRLRRHPHRSEEHTSELQSLMHISYAVFCLKKKTNKTTHSIRRRSKRHKSDI